MRCANRVSRAAPRSAALLLPAALLLALAAAPARPGEKSPALLKLAPSAAQQYDECLALARKDPQRAYDRAMTWRNTGGGGFPADHCAAVALVELGKYTEGAQKLEGMAGAMMQADPGMRAEALEQAGNAWLLANKPVAAKADFDAALVLKPKDVEILIDRAEANALNGKFFDAIDDLNRVLDISPKRVDALIYRASAYRQLGSLDLALDDATRALTLDPNALAGLLERGNIRRLKGDRDGAKSDWQRIMQLDAKSPEAKAARDNLARLAAAGEAGPGTGAAAKPSAKP
jgi:tetratricopeptide (TPR) repeat protein